MKKSNEIYLVVYKEKYCGEFYETYKEIYTTLLDAEELIQTLRSDENVSDIRLFVCHEQNIDYLKKKEDE